MKGMWGAVELVLGHARTIQVLTTVVVGTAVLAPLVVRLSGWAGLAGVLASLLVLCAGSLWSMRLELEVRHLPFTLLAFVLLATASVAWARYPLEALLSVLVLLAFGTLAAYVALTRDISQIVRAFGTVLRAVLAASLVLELVTGLLLDMPLPALGTHGNLIRLGPIQGLLGRAEVLGFVAVLAMVTFVVEVRMRALTLPAGVLWTVGATCMMLLSGSAIAIGLAAVAALSFAGLAAIRAAPPADRPARQVAVVLAAVAVVTVVWAARWPLAQALGGVPEALYRSDLWRQVIALFRVQSQQILGRGFVGRWNLDVAPYSEIGTVQSRQVVDASSAYIDALVQLGVVGLGLLALALVAATGRAWLLASRKRSVVYAWPAVVLTVIAASGIVMSQMLFELGWLLLVICAVKASHAISWRRAFTPPRDDRPSDAPR